jgi:hypothetical protein
MSDQIQKKSIQVDESAGIRCKCLVSQYELQSANATKKPADPFGRTGFQGK